MPDSKRYKMVFPLYGPIAPEKCTFMVLTTKVEIKLKKGRKKTPVGSMLNANSPQLTADATSWPTLRSDEATGEIIQIGQPTQMS